MFKKMISRAIFIVVLLCTVVGLNFSLVPKAEAASSSSWQVSTENLTLTNPSLGFLNNEPYVTDASVTYNGSGYQMWYAHGVLDITSTISGVSSLNLTSIINDISSLDINALLNDFSDLDAATLNTLITQTGSAIGYATSPDGIDWNIENPGVMGGTSNRVGTPTVIYNGSGFEMWYTNFTTSLNQASIQSIQTGLAGNVTTRKAAIHQLLHSISMSIGYATSPDGVTWTVVNPSALVGSGSLLDSYTSPSVVMDGSGGYEMWYTHLKTSLTDTNLDTILSNINTFSVTDMWGILNSITTTIGYATSTDGSTWTAQPSESAVLAGASGGMLDSVSSPCVIKSGSNSYEMWYTNVQSDLNTTSFSDLIHAVSSINFTSILNGMKADGLTGLLTQLLTVNLTDIKNLLSGTTSTIGYAVSSDGVTWAVQNANEVISGGGLWAGIGAPTVVQTPGAYQMWYTEGIPDLTFANVFALMDGSDLPLGHATLTTGATVEISVGLEGPGRPDPAGWIIPINITFCTPGTSTAVYSSNQTTVKIGSTAAANVTGVAPGTYDVYVVSEYTLINVMYNVVISAPSTSVNMGTLLEGNTNNDSQVTLADFNILRSVFGASTSVADFDRSGQVTLADFNLLRANFGKSSPVVITPP